MSDQFLPKRPTARLQKLSKRYAREERWHVLIPKNDETQADLEKRREHMIAEGKAHPDDHFIYYIFV